MFVVFIEHDFDAFEQDLVEHAPDVFWCSPVSVSAVGGKFDGYIDQVFGLIDVCVEGSEFAGYCGEFLLESFLLGAEHIEWDRIVVVSFEEFALFTFDLELLCRECVSLLFIIVLKKSKKTNDVLFVDASEEFVRSSNKNKLSPDNLQNILEALDNREDQDHFATVIANSQIAENDYNLAVSSYVEAEDTREVIDIIELNARIEQIVARQSELRTSIDVIVADLEGSK